MRARNRERRAHCLAEAPGSRPSTCPIASRRPLNRHKRVAKDAAEWQPKHNLCWFAGRVLAVKLEYGLTVDLQEAAALEAMLEGCRIKHVLRPYRPPPPEITVVSVGANAVGVDLSGVDLPTC